MKFGEEGGRGAIVPVGNVVPVGVELDLAVDEAEERRVREVAIGVRRVFIARGIDCEITRATIP